MSGATLESIAYGGWAHCLRLSNKKVELIITLDVGPRVIRFGTLGGPNLLKEFPEQMGKTQGPDWMSFGGHRLWHAPEVMPRTYAPDFDPVSHTWDGQVLTLTQETEATTGLKKSITIELQADRVELNHRLMNENVWAIEAAPWCLTVMAPGGRVIVPQEPFVEHGVSFEPARPLVLWQFTRMNDPRYIWGDRFIQLRQDESVPTKTKFGVANKQGWAAYQLGAQVFLKTFDWIPDSLYPDEGCNCEFFTMPGFLEVETLGPLSVIEPGEGVDHRETWFLFDALTLPEAEPTLIAALAPLLKEAL